MTFNREKYSSFFPLKVYRCPCLMSVVDDCFENDLNTFVEIHDEILEFVFSRNDISKVFATKCGKDKENCIFVCEKHLAVIILGMKKYSCTEKPVFNNTTVLHFSNNERVGETYCTGCIKNFLRKSTGYFYFKEF